MSPSETELLIAANAALADPAFRERVKEMHSQCLSLVQMVEGVNRQMPRQVGGGGVGAGAEVDRLRPGQ